jgi:Holliday junction resolvasome RuvABC endonuclease subunit
MKRIIAVGIDQSYTGTGVVVLQGVDHGDAASVETLRVEHIACTDTTRPDHERARVIAGRITEVLSDIWARPDVIVMEGYAHGSRFKREMMGELGGIIKASIFDWWGEQALVAPPNTLKKFVTGKGGGLKEMVLLDVFKKWNFSAQDNNLADAYTLARLGLAVKGFEVDALLRYQVDALIAWGIDNQAAFNAMDDRLLDMRRPSTPIRRARQAKKAKVSA